MQRPGLLLLLVLVLLLGAAHALPAVAAAAAAAAADMAAAAAAEDEGDGSYVLPPEDQQQQCSYDATASPAIGLAPKYCLAHDKASDTHLDNVRDVLELLGYTRTETCPEANVLWAWQDPFTRPDNRAASRKLTATHEHLRNLAEFQFVNQLPGTGYIATKPLLAKLSGLVRALPRTFLLPAEHAEWQAFLATPQGAAMEWVRKSPDHRGIEIIMDTRDASLEQAGPLLVQQLVRPKLIANRLWDVGFYVAVTSLEPLLAYIHTGGALLRFCSREYVRHITPETPASAYIIYGLDDYTPAKSVEEMAAHFADAGSDTTYGTTMALPALRSYLAAHGVDVDKWWLDVQSIVVQVLQLTTPGMRKVQAEQYTGQRTNFFSLLRFDCMLDEHGDTYLIEVNMSPGLYRLDAPLEQQLLSRQLVHDLLHLKGIAPGGHAHQFTPQLLRDLAYNSDGVALGEPACAGGCSTAADCHARPACMLCRACRSAWQNGVLQRVAAEHLGSRGFMRVHPPHTALAQHMQDKGVARREEVEGRIDDALVAAWLQAKCRQDFRWC